MQDVLKQIIPQYIRNQPYSLQLAKNLDVKVSAFSDDKLKVKQKLVKLGVIGTLPSNQVSDEHVMEVCKYFFKESGDDTGEELGDGSVYDNYTLPSKWINASSLLVLRNGLEVKVNSTALIAKTDYVYTTANHPVDHKLGVFYFEIKILERNTTKASVCVGFRNGDQLYTYQGFDGTISNTSNHKYSTPFGSHDVIGCGINNVDKTIFFTKNGVNLGVAFTDCPALMVPVVGLKSGSVMSNFGLSEEFIYDIVGYQQREAEKVYEKVLNEKHTGNYTSDTRFTANYISKPAVSTINNTDVEDPSTITALINQYFIHSGYIDVSKAFFQDLDTTECPSVTQEEEMLNMRIQLRSMLTQGEVEQAIQFVEGQLPFVDPELSFLLYSFKLLHVIKKAEWSEALLIAQKLQKSFPEKQDMVSDMMSLLAYENPQDCESGYLLSESHSQELISQINSKILMFLGMKPESSLERIYRATKASLSLLENEARHVDIDDFLNINTK